MYVRRQTCIHRVSKLSYFLPFAILPIPRIRRFDVLLADKQRGKIYLKEKKREGGFKSMNVNFKRINSREIYRFYLFVPEEEIFYIQNRNHHLHFDSGRKFSALKFSSRMTKLNFISAEFAIERTRNSFETQVLYTRYKHRRVLSVLCASLKPPPNKLMVTTTYLFLSNSLWYMSVYVSISVRVSVTKLG